MVATDPVAVKPVFGSCYNRFVTAYQRFLQQINELTDSLNQHYARHLVCRAGCSQCCHHHLSVFAVEAEAVRQAIAALPASEQQQVKQQARETMAQEARELPVKCPLLVNDRCAIYESRPVICRTQGLPLLLAVENGEAEVDFCPLNFTAPDAVEDLSEDKLVPLEKINWQLAVLNLQHCRERCIPDEQSGERISMSEVILQAVKL
jgi:uncharacterized protein